VPDRVLGQRQQQVGVFRHAHRVGGDHAHGVELVLVEDLAELLQAADRGAHRRFAEHIVGIETGRQADGIARGAHDVDAATGRLADVKAEAVGPEVDCCKHEALSMMTGRLGGQGAAPGIFMGPSIQPGPVCA
jgi:hypothetical protein